MAAITAPGARSATSAQALVWEAVKWPLRKALLGVYLAAQAARRRPVIALVVLVALLALLGAGLVVHQMTAPPTVTIEQPSLPSLPASVTTYLHGQRTFNGHEVWASMDTAARRAGRGSETGLQYALDQERAQGLQITRYVYSGGYRPAGGQAHYTVEVDFTQGGKTGSHTWFFTIDATGLISGVSSL